MKIKPKKYALGLFEALKDVNKKQAEEIIKKFVQVLITNNDTSQIDKIIDHFEALWNKEKNITKADISSARDLDREIVEVLKAYVVKLSGGKNIELSEKIDKTLLGGVVVKFDDRIMDNSLRTRLRALNKELKK